MAKVDMEFTMTMNRWFRAYLWLGRNGLPAVAGALLLIASARGWKPFHVDWHKPYTDSDIPTVAVWRRDGD